MPLGVEIGTTLIHLHHGAMRVREVVDRDGPQGSCPHITLDQVTDGVAEDLGAGPLRITMPLEGLDSSAVRQPASVDDVMDALELLEQIPPPAHPQFRRRVDNYRQQLAAGAVFGAAKVLRSTTFRQRDHRLSTGELELLNNARRAVATEVSASLSCSYREAEEMVRERLKKLISAG